MIGIPKTIDNDIPVIDKSFGFETAIEVIINNFKYKIIGSIKSYSCWLC